MPKIRVTLKEGASYKKAHGGASRTYGKKPVELVVDRNELALMRKDGLLNVEMVDDDVAPPTPKVGAPQPKPAAPATPAAKTGNGNKGGKPGLSAGNPLAPRPKKADADAEG